MPFASHHVRKKLSVSQKKRANRPCPCSMCRREKNYSLKVINRHLKIFGHYDFEDDTDSGTSSSDDDQNNSTSQAVLKGADLPSTKPLSYIENDYDSRSSNGDQNNDSISHTEIDYAMASSSDDDGELNLQSTINVNCESASSIDSKLEDNKESSSSIDSEEESDDSVEDSNEIYSEESARLPLFDGSSVKVIEALASYFAWFTDFPAISKNALSKMLNVNKKLLPSPNNLPDSYDKAMAFIKPFLLPLVTYHACVNDCIIYRKTPRYDYSQLKNCPICGASRYISANKPARTFVYYPLLPRWKRMYGNATVAEILQTHSDRCTTTQNAMKDVHDSPSWKQAFGNDGFSCGDPRGILLQLSTDGVNPFSSNKVNYSMWPITLSNLNLPRHVRSMFGSLMMVGIVPAQSDGGEPKSLDPFLEVVVDELLSLTDIKLFDAFKRQSFTFKATILNYVLDYPGCTKIFAAAGPTALQACLWCELRGWYVTLLDKVVFLGNQHFLPEGHELHKQMAKEFPKVNEIQDNPEKLTNDDILRNSVAHSKAKNKTQAANVMKATGSKGVNCFMLLPDNDRTKQCYPDLMHNIKNVIVHFFDLFTGKGYNDKVKNVELELGRFRKSLVILERNVASSKKSKGMGLPFLLSKAELKLADERVTRIRVPCGYGWQPRPFFSKRTYLKSHDWKQLAADGILKFCLRGCLGNKQRSTFFHLLNIISELTSEIQNKDELDALEKEVAVVCTKIEQDFPIAIQTISMHILHHIVGGIKAHGPVHSWWMFVYERFNSWISQRVKNRRHPEVTVMRTYTIFDWVQFMRLSGCVPMLIDTCTQDETPVDEVESVTCYHANRSEVTLLEKEIQRKLQPCGHCKEGNGTEGHDSSVCFHKKCRHTDKCSTTGRVSTWKEGDFVCINNSDDTSSEVGKIEYFLTFNYSNIEYVCAVLTAFNSLKEHSETGLNFVNTSFGMRKIVRSFSRPLVTGIDDTSEQIIWLLNLQQVKKTMLINS